MTVEREDAHQKPPEYLRSRYKHYQRLDSASLEKDPDLIDFSRSAEADSTKGFRIVRNIEVPTLSQSFCAIGCKNVAERSLSTVHAYEHISLPGLHFIPSLVPQDVQWQLLSRLLHRDLANPNHKTNIHTHYNLPYHICGTGVTEAPEDLINLRNPEYRASFFNCSPKNPAVFEPINPAEHKSITISQFLQRKLRWITLGGQYDWTRKVYPKGLPPAFPEDIGIFIHNLFPSMKPEAAIVNVYSPGDTLSLHRDVSEESDNGLVSLSLGCEGIFIVGLGENFEEQQRWAAVRLRSGDAVYMCGPCRYAWHGVPQIIADSCPSWLNEWPTNPDSVDSSETDSTKFEAWRGWLAGKRINLNVRQMRD